MVEPYSLHQVRVSWSEIVPSSTIVEEKVMSLSSTQVCSYVRLAHQCIAVSSSHSHAIFLFPSEMLDRGFEKFQDGFGNRMNGASCNGVYDLKLEKCQTFEQGEAPTTPVPIAPPTSHPTRRPTKSPTEKPSKSPTKFPTKGPTYPPTFEPSPRPTKNRPPAANHRPPSLAAGKTPVPTVVTNYSVIEPTLAPAKNVTTPNSSMAPTEAPVNSTFNITNGNGNAESTTAPNNSNNATESNSTVVPSKPEMNATLNSTNGEVEIEPTQAPTRKTTQPPMVPTRTPTVGGKLSPTRPPRLFDGGNLEAGSGLRSMCTFSAFKDACIPVQSFVDFRTAIEKGGDDIVFCGGFQILKNDSTPLRITEDMDIRCVEKCTIFGEGPFLEIGGAMSKIRVKNMKFMNSLTESAILISTMTSLSVTTFCDTDFESNNLKMGENGGAISIDQRSGVVNVVRSTFSANSATRGGAIYSHAWMLNIVESRFVANKAFHTGNSIFVGGDSQITLQSSTFILNTVETVGQGAAGNMRNYAVVIDSSKATRTNPLPEEYYDAGQNRMIMSGDCNGFYRVVDDTCDPFTRTQPP